METLKAVITADLHMTCDPRASDAIVPLMRMQRQFYDAFFEEIIALGPDIVILAGDNTVSGRKEDCGMLKGYLRLLKAHGIPVLLTPGNHDFDHCTKQEYEERYFPLLRMDARDPDSLSYAFTVKGVTFLSMDDSLPSGRAGFSSAAMRWLKAQLRYANASGNRTVFVSHRNLFSDGWQPDPSRYRLYPDSLVPLLKKSGVQIAVSGHLHDACVYRSGNLTELIPPMPLCGTHLYGLLTISQEEAEYALRPLCFQEPLRSEVNRKDLDASAKRKAAFAHMLGCAPADGEADFAMKFLEAVQSASVSDRREELLRHPACEDVLAKLGSSGTGIWMRCLLKEGRPAQNHAVIRLSRR